jgi:hypothetical protein
MNFYFLLQINLINYCQRANSQSLSFDFGALRLGFRIVPAFGSTSLCEPRALLSVGSALGAATLN